MIDSLYIADAKRYLMIKEKNITSGLILILLGAVFAIRTTACEQKPVEINIDDKPNIILIMTDDQGFRILLRKMQGRDTISKLLEFKILLIFI